MASSSSGRSSRARTSGRAGSGLEEERMKHVSDGSPAAKIYKLGMFGWTEVGSGLTGVSLSAVTLGDFDNDGWLDIALNGQTSNAPQVPLTRVYHNNGNLTFSDVGASPASCSR